jgi:tetratricopeptide (TPR) repeat protein
LLRLLSENRTRDSFAHEFRAFVSQFGSDPAALLAAAELTAKLGQTDLTEEAAEALRRQPSTAGVADLLVAEALLTAGRHVEALVKLEATDVRNSSRDEHLGFARDGLRVVALFAEKRPDEGQLLLEGLLAQSGLSPENLHRIAIRLSAMGESLPALRLLERAVALNPRHQASSTELVRLELALGRHEALPGHVRSLLKMRRPSRELLSAVAHAWSSDLFLLHPEQPALLEELRADLATPLRPYPKRPPAS